MLLYSPFPDGPSARSAAEALLSESLIACANILPAGQSLYVWQGTLTETAETLLIAKTTQAMAAQAAARLEALHPYDTPAILQLQAEANAPYAAWVEQMLSA
ncbi:MAG: divalent-cation tolerance protein CutA [Rickettsiales bacterium]